MIEHYHISHEFKTTTWPMSIEISKKATTSGSTSRSPLDTVMSTSTFTHMKSTPQLRLFTDTPLVALAAESDGVDDTPFGLLVSAGGLFHQTKLEHMALGA